MYHLLSYLINDHMPAWPDSPQLNVDRRLQIANGDVANTVYFSFYNHTGTHMDAPNHYLDDGVQIAQLPLECFIYEKPVMVEVPKDPCQKVTTEDLLPYADQIAECDLLLIHTGFDQIRQTDVPTFEQRGPGIGSDCAAWLVEHAPALKAVAVDFVSLASFSDQEDGDKTHRTLFRGKNGHFICGIEDVHMLPVVGKHLKKVIALPMLIQGIDSAPVTMVAETDD